MSISLIKNFFRNDNRDLNVNSVALGWNDLPDELITEIFSKVIPEYLLGLYGKPLVSLLNKKAARLLQNNVFWETKFKRYFPRTFAQMSVQQTKSVADWRKKFVETRSQEFGLNDSNAFKKDYIARFYSAVIEKDLVEFKTILAEIKDQPTTDDIFSGGLLIDLFLSNNKYPTAEGSILRLARRCKNQFILNELFSEIEASLKDVVNTNPRKMLKASISWAIHCLKPIEKIVELETKLFSIDKNPYKTIDGPFQSRLYEAGLLPIHIAAQAGNQEYLTYLLNQDSSLLNVYSIDEKYTPICFALEANEPETALLLINRGADITLRARFHTPPFVLAAHKGLKDIMEIMLGKAPSLLEQASDDDDDQGQTALDCAILQKHTDLALWLLEKGANFTHTFNIGGFGRTGLYQTFHIACKQGLLPVIKKIHELNPTCIHTPMFMPGCPDGISPICMAVSSGKFEVVEFILNEGVKFNIGYNEWDNPLMAAVYYKYFDIAVLLLKHGAERKPLPMTNRHRHQYPVSFQFHVFPFSRGQENPGFNLPWEPEMYPAAPQPFVLLWDLLTYIEEHSSADYAPPTSIHTLMHRKRPREIELTAAEALRDMIYNNESPDSIIAEMRTTINKDYRLRAVFKWYKDK